MAATKEREPQRETPATPIAPGPEVEAHHAGDNRLRRRTVSRPAARGPHPGHDLPLWAFPLLPLVNLVARVNLGVHAKLRYSFLVGAVLLLGLSALSLLAIHRMSRDVERLSVQQEYRDVAQQMIYAVTSQSHYRAMSLLTGDSANTAKIATAKKAFVDNLNRLESIESEDSALFAKVREADRRFAASSAKVLAMYEAGDIGAALKLHLDEEHKVSHELEAFMREFLADAAAETAEASTNFATNRKLLTNIVWGFSGASLILALLLGLVMSLAFVRPVRRISRVVDRVAAGDFTQRVEVPNRDEFGALSKNVNRMSEQLTGLSQKVLQLRRAEEELVRRAVALEATNAELEAFCYSVSHDLRTPLRGIDGFSQALLEDYGDKLEGAGKEYLQRVRAATQRMARLIDDLLKLSLLTRSKMQVEDVNLTEMAQGIAAELAQSHPDRQVEFTIAPGVMVKGDGKLLHIALENLLGNAWKFTAKQPLARIEFGGTQHEGKPAYFVRDNGAGFDMAYADKLFGAFQRLHKADEFEGSGIGLATVQRVINRHGGRIWAQGAVGQGATFYFTI